MLSVWTLSGAAFYDGWHASALLMLAAMRKAGPSGGVFWSNLVKLYILMLGRGF